MRVGGQGRADPAPTATLAWWAAAGSGEPVAHAGGGEQCAYPEVEPSAARRRPHLAVSNGFGLGIVSTVAAAVMQNLLGLEPPYPYLSVPVVTGTVGGVATVVGSLGLMVLKRRSDPALSTASIRGADFGLLWALLILNATGLLTPRPDRHRTPRRGGGGLRDRAVHQVCALAVPGAGDLRDPPATVAGRRAPSIVTPRSPMDSVRTCG